MSLFILYILFINSILQRLQRKIKIVIPINKYLIEKNKYWVKYNVRTMLGKPPNI